MVSKMENKKINVLEYIIAERSTPPEYLDEAIFSDLYHTSFHTSLRAIQGYPDRVKKEHQRDGFEWFENEWIRTESDKACNIRVIDFDNLVSLLDSGKASCDAFFYNFECQTGEFHFISEFKRADKQTLIRLLKDESRDGLYRKIKDSIESIRQHFLFGGNHEADSIIENMHFFAVYAGKNTSATSEGPQILSGKKTSKDSYGKQNRAIRNGRPKYSEKDEDGIYQRFGKRIAELGMKPCTEDTFPGNAIPRVKKAEHGSEKIRYFTIFSAQDFGQLIDSGYFDCWKWGEYLPDTESIAEGIAENT